MTLEATQELAECYGESGNTQDAVKLTLEVLALMKSKLGPDNPTTLVSMIHAATWLGRSGRDDEAVGVIDECVRRARDNGIGAYLVNSAILQRLRYFEKRRDVTGCRTSAEMWEGFKRTGATDLYNAACLRAVAERVLRASDASRETVKSADVEADRAMEWLVKAVAAGFSDSALMKTDKDLESLREREGFKTLLADLEGKRPLIDRAWQLATDPDLSRRDPAKAVSLAEGAVARAPNDAKWWDVLGVARYRAGDARGAISALERQRELNNGEIAPTPMFFLAMAQWQLGKRDQARQWYSRALGSIAKNAPTDAVMLAAQVQAGEMLKDRVAVASASLLDRWDRQAWIMWQKNKAEDARALRAKIVEAASGSYSKGDSRLVKLQCASVELLLQMKCYPDAAALAREALESLPAGETVWRSKCLGYLVEAYKQSENPEEEARHRELLRSLQQARRPSTRPTGVAVQLPVTRPSADTLDIEAFSPTRNPVGSMLTIRGRVGFINSTKAHNAVNIEFATSAALMVWVPTDVYEKLVRENGPDAIEALRGRTICIHGRVEYYAGFVPEWQDRLEFKVQDAHQFWLVADEPSSPASVPASPATAP
jgi:tetratricopeptide (TPR) repeat protein